MLISIDQRRKAVALEKVRTTLRAFNVDGHKSAAIEATFCAAWDKLNGMPGLQARLTERTRDEIAANNRDPTPPGRPTAMPMAA